VATLTERFAVEPGRRDAAVNALRAGGWDVEDGGVERDRRDDAWPVVVVRIDAADGSVAAKQEFTEEVGKALAATCQWRLASPPTPYVNREGRRRLRLSRIFARPRSKQPEDPAG
jgi:hypothetical protein